MNWRLWLQLLIGMGGSIPGPTGALINLVLGAVNTLDLDITQNSELADKWIAWLVNVIVTEKREFTQEEHDQARAFADEIHAANQNA